MSEEQRIVNLSKTVAENETLIHASVFINTIFNGTSLVEKRELGGWGVCFMAAGLSPPTEKYAWSCYTAQSEGQADWGPRARGRSSRDQHTYKGT